MPKHLRASGDDSFDVLVGVGGIGTGIFFELDGTHTMGRNESRQARMVDQRDYCKLHINTHYIAVLLGAGGKDAPFRAVPVGKVGDDDAGRRLLDEMSTAGIDTSYIQVVPGMPTLLSVCFQYPDGSGGNITTSDSAASQLTENDVERVAPIMHQRSARSIALAVPEAPLSARRRLLEIASEAGALRIASFSSGEIGEAAESEMLSRVDLLAMNEDEAVSLTNADLEGETIQSLLHAVNERVSAKNPSLKVIVSAGSEGAYGYEDGNWDSVPAPSVSAVGTAGAGDALLGSVVAALAVGIPFMSALAFGVIFATFTVTSPHTIHPGANLETVLRFARDSAVPVPDELLAYTTE